MDVADDELARSVAGDDLGGGSGWEGAETLDAVVVLVGPEVRDRCERLVVAEEIRRGGEALLGRVHAVLDTDEPPERGVPPARDIAGRVDIGRCPACGVMRDALAALEPGQSPLAHSDQGFQYQHASWRRLLREAGATQSMSRKGNCYDNAVMENFFGHLKEEAFHHIRFLSIDALEPALHEYIRWCNHDRVSTKLEGLSPV